MTTSRKLPTRPTLVLVPGLLCDAEVWRDQRAALSADADVHIADHGHLDRIEAMAQRLLARIEAPRFALVGHSMGARVALEVVRQAPERVSHLALLDCGVAPLPAGAAGEDERRRRLALLTLAREQGMGAMARTWARPMVHPGVLDTPLFERIVAMVERHDLAQAAAQVDALLHRPDATEVLRAVACPLLVLCGEDDSWSPPAQHQAMAALVPGARLRLVPHCGHMSPMEQPEAVTTALREWLSPEVAHA